MEGDAGAQVAPPIYLHQGLLGRFHEGPSMAKKRDLSRQTPVFYHSQQQNHQQRSMESYPGANWNPKMWQWDSTSFVARPAQEVSDEGAPSLGKRAVTATQVEQRKKGEEKLKGLETRGENRAVTRVLPALGKGPSEDGENLTLKLGGSSYSSLEEPVVRPNKRVRSGSPGSGNAYPKCQVDDCKADLSNAKDYHRRHKVCEIHSKTIKALVGKQMQRFCQQCSRFHPLSEFDEGKRSCRRRLAGHNRRRRKTQPEDTPSKMLLSGSQDNNGSGNMDIVNVLSMLARLQGTNLDKGSNGAALPDSDRLIQIITKINSASSENSKENHPESGPGGFDLNVPQTPQSSEQLPRANGNTSAKSTVDLLTVVSAALKSPNPDTSLSQGSSGCITDNKAKISSPEHAADVNSHNLALALLPSTAIRRSNQSSSEFTDLQQARSMLPLQLLGSAEDESPPKMGSLQKYLSSESSNPMEDRSPSSSPPVAQKLFPLHLAAKNMKNERKPMYREDVAVVEASTSQRWISPSDLVKNLDKRMETQMVQSSPYRAGGYISSSSDHSPSSSNSDVHDRTGRIMFKLFGKDPSNFPATVKSQILNWLSNIPTEMESYIRPGCIVLTVYLSMPPTAWDELQEDMFRKMQVLLQSADSDFWSSGRFLFRTDRQLASHKDGKIRMCKNWKTWSSPELVAVSPLAIVGGEEATLVLRGRNLTVPGTKIHCTYMGGYTSKEVLGSAYPGTVYDDSSVESFCFPGGAPKAYGRCFIEVENGFKGNNFPIIIADENICRELRILECELEELRNTDILTDDQVHEDSRPRSREDILHFLNELGWLLQRRNLKSRSCFKDFSCRRFKFLLIFAVERDWSTIVKNLLDTLVERSFAGDDEIIQESLEILSEIQLLSRAVKRKCRKMVDLLLGYSVDRGINPSRVYLFPPNVVGPGGITPLHLAASMQETEDMIDALTDDPQEIALDSWNSVVDDNGQSPYTYASMRNNHSYNRLVARKLADRKNGQVSITVENEEISLDKSWIVNESDHHNARALPPKLSCKRCAVLENIRSRGTIHAHGLLTRPYVHSMLAIAAVCVCVCLFLRGAPQLGTVAPFKWENLEFGPR